MLGKTPPLLNPANGSTSPAGALGASIPPAAPVPSPPPEAGDSSLVGQKLGKYQVTGLLGKGGMGAVYEARDELIDRPVAIKVLPESVAADEQVLTRFLMEARSAGRLNHPNAVAVFDVDQRGSMYYIVMELVRGGSVAEFLEKRGPFNWPEATRIASDACKALVAAHAAGMIHRDIKPANIMRAHDGTVKIADFGLAKNIEADTANTRTGNVMGTPLYMSPEQCQAEKLDRRTDIYSLGATYFALLTGRAPFEDLPSFPQIMFAHCYNEVPDPRHLNPTIPQGCVAVVMRAMAKSPDHRYQTAAEMLADLEAIRPDVLASTSRRAALSGSGMMGTASGESLDALQASASQKALTAAGFSPPAASPFAVHALASSGGYAPALQSPIALPPERFAGRLAGGVAQTASGPPLWALVSIVGAALVVILLLIVALKPSPNKNSDTPPKTETKSSKTATLTQPPLEPPSIIVEPPPAPDDRTIPREVNSIPEEYGALIRQLRQAVSQGSKRAIRKAAQALENFAQRHADSPDSNTRDFAEEALREFQMALAIMPTNLVSLRLVDTFEKAGQPARQLSISNDGHWLALAGPQPDRVAIYAVPPQDSQQETAGSLPPASRPLPPPLGVWPSPDQSPVAAVSFVHEDTRAAPTGLVTLTVSDEGYARGYRLTGPFVASSHGDSLKLEVAGTLTAPPQPVVRGRERSADNASPVTLALSADGHWLAYPDPQGRLAIWNLPNGQLDATRHALGKAPQTLAISAQGSVAVAVMETSDGNTPTRMASCLPGEPQPEFWTAQTPTVTALATSPDGRWTATGHADGSLRVWASDSLGLAWVSANPGDTANHAVTALAFSADATRLAVATADSLITCHEVLSLVWADNFESYKAGSWPPPPPPQDWRFWLEKTPTEELAANPVRGYWFPDAAAIGAISPSPDPRYTFGPQNRVDTRKACLGRQSLCLFGAADPIDHKFTAWALRALEATPPLFIELDVCVSDEPTQGGHDREASLKLRRGYFWRIHERDQFHLASPLFFGFNTWSRVLVSYDVIEDMVLIRTWQNGRLTSSKVRLRGPLDASPALLLQISSNAASVWYDDVKVSHPPPRPAANRAAAARLEAVIAALMADNPGYDGQHTFVIRDDRVVWLELIGDGITNLRALTGRSGLPELLGFKAVASAPGRGKLADVTPLADLKLLWLDVRNHSVEDFAALRQTGYLMFVNGRDVKEVFRDP